MPSEIDCCPARKDTPTRASTSSAVSTSRGSHQNNTQPSSSMPTSSSTGTTLPTSTTTGDTQSNSNHQSQTQSDALSTSQSSTNKSDDDAPTRPITKAAKLLLREQFVKAKWTLNKGLPKGKGAYPGDLQKIVDQFGLKREQVRRQLNNYKKEVFGNSKITLTLSPEEIRDKINEGLLMSNSDFVNETIKKISSKESESSSCFDVEKFAMVLGDFPIGAHQLLDLWIDLPDNDERILLARLIEKWIDFACEEFPKTAARISNSELQFLEKFDKQKAIFISQWMERFVSIGGTSIKLTEHWFRYFGSWLHDILFEEWSYCAMDSEKPSVSIPDECLVGKYARPVIYYVAGWTLHSLSKALTIAQDKRGVYQRFSTNHCLGADEAKDLDLPVSVVQRRKRWANTYPTKVYYEFICFVESVYLDNLTLEMMMAHADGDIIHVIKIKLLNSSIAKDRFAIICNNDNNYEPFSDGEMMSLLKYILERYANMRGSYFVKYLKGTTKRSSVDKLVQSQATRTKVVNAAACSKAAEEAKREVSHSNEKQLWQDASDSVIEKSKQMDREETDMGSLC